MQAQNRPPPIVMILPGLGAILGLVALVIVSQGGSGFFYMLRSGGIFAWLALGMILLGAALNTAVAALHRTPAALFGISALPWLVGLVGTFQGHRMVQQALGYVAPNQLGSIFLMGSSEIMVTRVIGAVGTAGLAAGAAAALLLSDARRWALALLSGALSVFALTSALAAKGLQLGLAAAANAAFEMRAMLLMEALAEVHLYEVVRTGAMVLVVLSALVALGLAFSTSNQKVTAVVGALSALVLIGADSGAVHVMFSGAEELAARLGSVSDDFEPVELTGGERANPELRMTPSGITALRDNKTVGFDDPKLQAKLRGMIQPGAAEHRNERGGLLGAMGISKRGGRAVIELDRRVTGTPFQRALKAFANMHVEELVLVGHRPRPSPESLTVAENFAPVLILAAHGQGTLALPLQGAGGAPGKAPLSVEVKDNAPLVLMSASGETVDTVRLSDPPAGERGMGKKVLLTLSESASADTLAKAAQALLRSGYKPGLLVDVAKEVPLKGALGQSMLGMLGTSSGLEGSGAGFSKGIGRLGTKRRPKVISGRADVLGSLDKEIIRRVMRRHTPKMRYCYEKELVKAPSLAGKVSLKMTISAEGKVVAALTKASTLDSPAVERCITRAARRFRFPAPKGGGIVIVNYPLVFRPGA